MMLLVTGGAGYIGSHVVVELLHAGYDVVVLDNLCNASAESLERVERITGRSVNFFQGDVRDHELLDTLFTRHSISAVLHFAGLKVVGESVTEPLEYYNNNVYGTLVLCQAMARAGVYSIVFSSSAAVYGDMNEMPVSEECATAHPTNPYGRSKLMVEEILQDLSISDSRWQVALLRYFNPVGAHESGLIGEDPQGTPNNLLPVIMRVATGHMEKLHVYGGDYPTDDGTGVRDYIHVVDLALGHVAALSALREGVQVWNLGTGHGYSVLEIIRAFERASGRSVPFQIVDRRPGDIAECYASTEKAARDLGWRAQRDLLSMMADSWRWYLTIPHGYK